MEATLIADFGTPFLRGADSFVANAEGIGLGLAIAVQLVALPGGKRDLRNRLPHGLAACASFSLSRDREFERPYRAFAESSTIRR